MSEQRRSVGPLAVLAAGAVIGAVEVVLAISFAALVFGGTVLPGVMVGEIALYTAVSRTADVVTEIPSVVLRLSRASIERMEAEEPRLAATPHRWFAGTLAERLTDRMRTLDSLSTE